MVKGKELLKQFLKEKDDSKKRRKGIFNFSTLFNYFNSDSQKLFEEVMEWAYNKGLHTWDKKDFEEVFGD